MGERAQGLFEDSVLVARHSVFEFIVLAKTFRSYGAKVPEFKVFDTMRLCDLGLAEACHRFGIAMDRHHDAISDALACRDLLWTLSNGRDIRPRPFHLAKRRRPAPLTKEACEAISKLLMRPKGFLEGISLDRLGEGMRRLPPAGFIGQD